MREPNDQRTPASSWRNWAGDQQCTPAQLRRPRSLQELQTAVADAREHGWRVRVAGSGHSFTDIACTDGMMLSLGQLGGVLELDRDTAQVRVQAGITIRALSAYLLEHGLALENLGDIDVQTIAGAISTATHGTGAGLANIPSQVRAMTLVVADGSLLECSAEKERDVFRAARVSLGALGVIAEVTLQCVPAFTLRGVDAPAPLDEVLEGFEERVSSNDHFEFFVFPHTRTALTRTNNRTDDLPKARSRAAAYVNDVLLNNHAFGLFCRAGRRFPRAIPALNGAVTRLASSSERVERSAAIFSSPRLVRFTEMEYAIPRERTPEAVRRVMRTIVDRGFDVPFPIEVRAVAPDDAFISTAAGRESGFVAVHMFERMEWEPYFRAVEQIMDELDGRPHWGKRHFQTAATLRPRYPDWDRFQAMRVRLDPEGRFGNAFTDRVLGAVDA